MQNKNPAHNPHLPPQVSYGNVNLPGTRLHYVKAGSGPPLVIVPATISLISQWLPLVQFMGQRFTSYFFELPGHGGSTPYPDKFESNRVPATVEAFVNEMGHDTFNLMGFSFGGLLALRTLEYLKDRVDKVILLAPVVSHQALKWSRFRYFALKAFVKSMKNSYLLRCLHFIMNMPQLEGPMTIAMSKASAIDRHILENRHAMRLPLSTLDVLTHTLDEILTMKYVYNGVQFNNPCYFGMSINDNLLKYDLTQQIVRDQFEQVKVQKFTYPYHQPPEPPTFKWLVGEFTQFLESID